MLADVISNLLVTSIENERNDVVDKNPDHLQRVQDSARQGSDCGNYLDIHPCEMVKYFQASRIKNILAGFAGINNCI